MNNDIRWKQRFQNFEKAYQVFLRRVDEYKQDPHSEAFQMALIQAFEIIQELSWKVLKDYLEYQGYNDVQNSKKVFRTAFKDEIITNDAEVWMQSIEKRNFTSHAYDEETSQNIITFVVNHFCLSVEKLYHQLKAEL